MNKVQIELLATTVFEFFLLCIGPILIGCSSFALIGLICVIILIPINGIITALSNFKGTVRTTPTQKPQLKEEDLTVEDSQGDGLMSEGDIMFPEENEDED
jgi:hypothetical protein